MRATTRSRWPYAGLMGAVLAAGGAFSASPAAASTPYPNNHGGALTPRFHFEYPGIVSVSEPHPTSSGFFKLRNGSADTLSGGWLHVTTTPDTPQSLATFNDTSLLLPFQMSQEALFTRSVPRSVRNQIHIDMTITSTPWNPGPVSVTPHVFRFPLNVGDLESIDPVNFPRILLINTAGSCSARWVDQRIVVRYEIWLDGTIADPFATGTGRYVLEQTLRAQQDVLTRVSPYLVPVSLIGQPPGNLSWSRLTADSLAGAGFGFNSYRGTTTTTQSSFGFGPFSDSGPVVSVSRNMSQGIQQTFSAFDALSLQTHDPAAGPTPFGPGRGDLLFCLVRPSFNMFRAVQDRDFKYLSPAFGGGAQAVTYFPMAALLNPQPGTPPAFLSSAENAAIRALNPLLANPKTALPQPRFYRVLGPVSGQTGALNGSSGFRVVNRQEVNTATGRSTTVDNSVSFDLPLGAISSAVGLPFPVPDVGFRNTETTTSTVEYRTVDLQESAVTRLMEYHVSDSDPLKWLFFEVYYDTLFRTFLFRDNSPEPNNFRDIRKSYKLDTARLPRFFAFKETDGDGSTYLLIGSAAEWAPKGGMVRVWNPDQPLKECRAFINPSTGNLVLTGLKAGVYNFRVIAPGEKTLLADKKLTLTTTGEVTLK